MTANGCVLAGLLGTCLVGLGANAQADGLPSRGHRPASDLFGPSWRGYIVAEGPISADGGYWFRIVPAQSIVATPSPSARPGGPKHPAGAAGAGPDQRRPRRSRTEAADVRSGFAVHRPLPQQGPGPTHDAQPPGFPRPLSRSPARCGQHPLVPPRRKRRVRQGPR